MIATRHDFENRETLAKALSRRVAMCLSKAITNNGSATLAVSGGTTPSLFLTELSKQEITWEKIIVTLVDERQVPESHIRSNARLVKALLLCNNAAAAKFIPLLQNEKQAAKLKLDCVVLGMGDDGHTASFFPGGDNLVAALDVKTVAGLITMEAPGAGEPRLTFTLAKLLQAQAIFLHIEGAKKQSVLQVAISGKDVLEMPIRAVLQAEKPVDVYWCP